MARMDEEDEDKEAFDADPLEFTFILALEKAAPIARGPTAEAGICWFFLFHFSRSSQNDFLVTLFPSLKPSLPAPQISLHPGSED